MIDNRRQAARGRSLVILDKALSYIRFLGDIFQILDGSFGRVVYKMESERDGRERAFDMYRLFIYDRPYMMMQGKKLVP